MASVPFTRKDRVPCRHFQQGKCNRGKSCPFSHAEKADAPKNTALTAILKLVFEKHADRLLPDGGRMLDLSEFAKCPDLEKVANSVDFDAAAFCEAVVSVVRSLHVDVHFIRLDKNNIRSLNHFLKALERADLHNGIRALSAADNNIATLEFVKRLKPFSNLAEVQFLGNPVADQPDYRSAIRKGLPDLEGLDGAGVNRPPLNLPWPKNTDNSDEGKVALLQELEGSLFRVLEEGGSIDSLSGLYGDDATFSLTCDSDALVKAPTLDPSVTRRSVITRDFVAMRMAQTDRNSDIKQSRSVRVARGRTDVCSALRNTMYPRALEVRHVLSPDSDVAQLNDGVKAPLYVFTLHGCISWRHKEQPDGTPVVSRTFDRTLVVCTREGGNGFFITSDAVTLRLDSSGPPLWFAQNEARAEAWAAKHGLPPPVVQAVFNVSTTDIDAHAAATDLAAFGAEPFDACAAATSGDLNAAVVVARVCYRAGCDPAAASQALAAAEGDVDAACASLGV
eukprot:CAMPEP_0174843966 /NCGR_PEP_ID=MMETSP1114-20130205/10836_1 /TAXON_ID=312471 /ORGANISM="Neobodo designis, Strain CCAP 1951/1" /LENGTH=506 /DNA_ID=CAMNT_0016078199 /DNA_START=163 /DNA_END=1679 /DNA_ORIENTATION=+